MASTARKMEVSLPTTRTESVANQHTPTTSTTPAQSTLSYLFTSPVFWSFLIVRLILGAVGTSYFMSELFVPFVNFFVESGFSNPWEHFFRLGITNAFPYPPPMLYGLSIFRVILDPLLPSGVEAISAGHLLALRLPILMAETGILVVLMNWFSRQRSQVMWLYWASPVVLFISFWHGQVDAIPSALFILTVDQIRRKRFIPAMLAYSLALGMKSHLVVVLPFLLVYLYQEKKVWGTLKLTAMSLLSLLAVSSPYLWSHSFREMVFNTPEKYRAVVLQIPLGQTAAVLIAPLVIALLFFRFSTYRKRNWDLFMLYLGMVFSVFVLLSKPAPGYYYWSIPFLIYFTCRSQTISPLLYWAFSAAYMGYAVFAGMDFHGPLPTHWPSAWTQSVVWHFYAISALVPSIWGPLAFTLLEASLIGLVYQMYLFGIRSNEIYHLPNRPITVGISGDSGAGKDTLIHLLAVALGKSQTTEICGDNYHRWERGHSQWKAHTHLDAKANELHGQFNDLQALAEGKEIVTRVYDHSNGKFTHGERIQPKRYILMGGLHSFLHERQRALLDLKVFLDPEEALRRYWKLRRDVGERKHSPRDVISALDRRRNDRKKFILPQKEGSDLIVRYKSTTRVKLDAESPEPPLALEVWASNSINWLQLGELLSSIPGIQVQHEPFVDPQFQQIEIRGQISRYDLERIAQTVIPNLEELCDSPQFDDNLNGCLQLLCLSALSQRLRTGRRAMDKVRGI